MFQSIITFSVRNKAFVLILVAALIGGGIYAMRQLPVDAVPDITNNQVQIVTTSPSLAAEEVERFITYPLEMAMGHIPGVTEVRSISRFGLSVITVVFEDDVPVLDTRQYVQEQLNLAKGEIPEGMGSPEMMPITTGLGEIYQYVLQVDSAYKDQYDAMKLRTIQDWIVNRQFTGTEGLVEVSSFGGFLKQYEVAADPLRLQQYGFDLSDLQEALASANQNSGGGFIEKNESAFYLRSEGLLESEEEIGQVVIGVSNGVPVLVRDVAEVRLGFAPRFGAMSMDGEGEVVGGITLMLRGANSSQVIENVHERVKEIQKALPPGVHMYAYLDRSDLVGRAIDTVSKNLVEGGLIVIFVLVLLLGNVRAGLLVASIIPLSMLFAFIMMNLFGVSANLMSLGAIDFGIVVDGAVIIVEHLLFVLHKNRNSGRNDFDKLVIKSSSEIYRSAAFGVLIILVVFIPILTLTGIEGKMFRPMAQTFGFAILGAMLLSLTYVPAVSAFLFRKGLGKELQFSHKLVGKLQGIYQPVLKWALKVPYAILGFAVLLLAVAVFTFSRMGQEFIPQLDEGDMAVQMTLPTGSGLSQSLEYAQRVEKRLLNKFPEVIHVVSKIGSAEVPTDPMAVEEADIMIILKPQDEWTSADNREDLAALMKEELRVFKGLSFEFTQPIQLRFNELITGAKTDIAIKIFGEDMAVLADQAEKAARLIRPVEGAGDVKVEQTEGLPQLRMRVRRDQMARYGVSSEDVQNTIRSAFSGFQVGSVFEGQRKFELMVRLAPEYRESPDLDQIFISTPTGSRVPLSELVDVSKSTGPAQVSREATQRRINVGVNVRNRDLASVVEDIRTELDAGLDLPPGYTITYGGQFENLQKAKDRLMIAVPIALVLIFLLLYFTFGSFKHATMIFAAVPLSIIGGIFALYLRGLPFSISAGVGFITLFGVSVLNGIVLISHFNELRMRGEPLWKAIVHGATDRLRPVMITATVATLGFLPMALSSSAGAEVQRPLATVVIGGLISATFLTLVVLPILYELAHKKEK